MKKLFSILLVALTTAVIAQPKGKEPHMAPVLAKGYYVNQKGDSVKIEVQTNYDDPVDIYRGFNFRLNGAGKVTAMSTKKAKAYGFEGRHFTLVPYDEMSDIYIERIVNGRLKFYEYKFHDKKNGEAVITSAYYIQDTRAEEKDAELKEMKPINTNFYKNDLKPYMKDQKMTWTDLDKFTFNRAAVIAAITEFNKFYEQPQPE